MTTYSSINADMKPGPGGEWSGRSFDLADGEGRDQSREREGDGRGNKRGRGVERGVAMAWAAISEVQQQLDW